MRNSVSDSPFRKPLKCRFAFNQWSTASSSVLMDAGPTACPICGAVFASSRQLAGHRAGKHRQHVGVKACTIHVDKLSEWQKGYIAAFLDGEGGIQITLSKRKDREYTLAMHPDVYFTNTNEEAIRTIRAWLGGGSITRRRDRRGRKDMFVLTISGVSSILQLLETIRAMLIIKARRADLMMEFCRSRMSHNRGKGRRFTENELRLYTAIKMLNRRGGGVKKRQRTEV